MSLDIDGGQPTATGTAAATDSPPRKVGRITGAVAFSGVPPKMVVPARRSEHDICNRRAIPSNAVLVHQGKLQDVLVRIEVGGVPGVFPPPERPLVVRAADCMYEPRIAGAVSGQDLIVERSERALYTPYARRGSDKRWAYAFAGSAMSVTRNVGDPAIIHLSCTTHEWMLAFILVTDHPFFAVSDRFGYFAIEGVPPGKYVVEAWHSVYGWKRQADVVVRADETVQLRFAYSGDEQRPEENRYEQVGPAP